MTNEARAFSVDRYAAATMPTAGSTISTSAEGLHVGVAEVPSRNGTVHLYHARPEHGNKFPIVMVLSEIFGVHAHIADVCRRFAKRGYLAVAPELFERQGDPSAFATIPEIFSNIIAKVPDAQVLGDIDAAVSWATSNGGLASRIGVNGFCWGGRITWLYAAHNPDVRAGVAWYGRLIGEKTTLMPRNPVDVAASLYGPVLGLYAGQDPGITQESVTEMRHALEQGNAAAKHSNFVVYSKATHAFFADYRASYEPESARNAWDRCLDWLQSHGV